MEQEVVQDSRPACFALIYFTKDGMIPCTEPDEELSCPVTTLEDIDKVTLLGQKWLSLMMGEFALPWKYFHKKNSALTVQPIRFTFVEWYSYLFTQFPIVQSQYTWISWISFLKIRLYPLLRLCTKWLKCAFEHKTYHGDLMNCIYFKTDIEPQLLIRKGFDQRGCGSGFYQRGCDSYKGDLKTIRHFLFVIVNRRSPADLMVNRLNYNVFNEDVPHYLIDFLKLLATFDERKHLVDVFFNPSFLWSIEKKFKHLDEAFNLFIQELKLHRKDGHTWWEWYPDFKKLPENHTLKKRIELAGSPAMMQTDSPESVPWNATYKDNVDLLRLFRNAKCHVTEMFAEFGWTQDLVLEAFEDKFNILWKLSRTCNKYALDLEDRQLCKDFLERLGYITRETP